LDGVLDFIWAERSANLLGNLAAPKVCEHRRPVDPKLFGQLVYRCALLVFVHEKDDLGRFEANLERRGQLGEVDGRARHDRPPVRILWGRDYGRSVLLVNST
jgi:hypothetical protein